MNKGEYKHNKSLHEATKKKSGKHYFSKLIEKNKDNAKKTWDIMKEIIGKIKTKTKNLSRRTVLPKT